jgi:type II restriction/modification system DNA methylase subunit YeeA
MTPDQFIEKWRASTLKERSASQSHFNDLCKLLGVDNPTDADPTGERYCFERGASKTAGGEGWADVWMRNHFGWEYKGKRKDLTAAFAQLQQYAVALENPPLLVVSDMERIVIHTNWTNTVSEVHSITLDDLRDANKRDLLRAVFIDPERLKPKKTIDALTRDVADTFAGLAISLREAGNEPQAVAHFVNRLVFCMFAEDINLLPRRLFSQILDKARLKPAMATAMLSQLFEAMRAGGLFGVDEIEWFNGGLFDDATALPLTVTDIKTIARASEMDWSDIDPSIFGTLFERGLDPAKRSQLGAHYTDPEKIMMIVRPVIIEPLWREWEGVKAQIEKPKTPEKKRRELLGGFLERLRGFRVLDPACGSGNFLYLALLALKDIEHRVNLEAEAMGFGRQFPTVGPEVVQGIELNPYAAELARVTIWIGEIQWMRKNGFDISKRPILKPLKNIENRDALLNPDGSEAVWPDADATIGNPPFVGDKKMLALLGDAYVSTLRAAYADRVAGGADFVMYWFEKAWRRIEAGHQSRAGFVATQSIRRGASSAILKQIAAGGRFFEAWQDEEWTVDGAAVRVCLACFDKGKEGSVKLNGKPATTIHADLSAGATDLTLARKLPTNTVAYIGDQKTGPFDIEGEQARAWLLKPLNPNGRPNSDVLKPWANGNDVTGRPLGKWIVDFGTNMPESEAALYEAPFGHVAASVRAQRTGLRETRADTKWWIHQRPRPAMRAAIAGFSRYLVTPRVSKHRLFLWLDAAILPDSRLVVIARDDDVTFGILHSRFHEAWSLQLGGWHGVGNDPQYTPSLGFETFPFPKGLEPTLDPKKYKNPHAGQIAEAAKRLNALRENWLNPPDLVKRVPEVVAGYPDRIEPVGIAAKHELKNRTLTNLYNARPAWLGNAHAELDAAVAAAYGWTADISEDEALKALLALNLTRTREK